MYKDIDNILNDMLSSGKQLDRYFKKQKDILTPRTLELVDLILDYNWEAEEKNWLELDQPENHIFLVLRELSTRLHNLDIEGKEKK
jgi:hypothetical protein